MFIFSAMKIKSLFTKTPLSFLNKTKNKSQYLQDCSHLHVEKKKLSHMKLKKENVENIKTVYGDAKSFAQCNI